MVFRGIFAYHFQQDTLTNIIFDIKEVAVIQILKEAQVLFDTGRAYGWPGLWNRSDEALQAYLTENAAQGFKIASSCGLDGWVLAQSMEFIVAMPSS